MSSATTRGASASSKTLRTDPPSFAGRRAVRVSLARQPHSPRPVPLGNFLADQPQLGRVFFAPFDVIFTRWDVVEPDLLVIAGDQLDILTTRNVQGAPAIVVEILSPGTRKVDAQIKRRLFDRGGVREYWLIDPELDIVKVYRREVDGSFPRVAEFSREADDVLTSPVLPGWSLSLGRLLADD